MSQVPPESHSDPLTQLLESFARLGTSPADAAQQIRSHLVEPLGFANIDHDRRHRCGNAEVVYGAGKTPAQVAQIVGVIRQRSPVALITRATPDHYRAIVDALPSEPIQAGHRQSTILVGTPPIPDPTLLPIPIVTAGTSDEPVAEEAALTCLAMGHKPHRINDIGVAGLHRLSLRLPELRGRRVIICIAGMEGALPSVLGGLVDSTIIGVPTSVGYGASFGGVSALLGMLNSCASGMVVVNIDNGFGAAVAACRINRP